MTDIIHLLSDDLANKIAAGEVVVRPAAVVKELLENAIDAGATDIQLFVKNGGKSLIQVIDNGIGMSETDARMSFERHATSKITTIDDLFAINTMGFRGEALASIAAVAKVTLKTKQEGETIGTELKIDGATFIDQSACQTPKGTNIAVKSLFYNVPARRKFLKSDAVETKHILEEFTRIALAHPHIKLSMFNNDKETFHLPAQNLHKRIVQLFGKRNEDRLVQVNEETDIVSVSGYVGKPEFAKKTKGEQYFFVNNRFIKSGYLNHAVYRAFADFIDSKQYPLYVLNLTIDPQKIDINVHPSKHEVKFEDQQHIYTIVSAAVRHALSKFAITPTLDFDSDPTFNRHEFFKQPFQQPIIENTVEKKKSTFLKREAGSAHAQNNQNWQELYKLDYKEEQQIEQIAQQQTTEHSTITFEQNFTQLNAKYIVVQEQTGFLLIDQRRAHQRIIYETLLQSFETNGIPSQKLLFPETIEVNPAQFQIYQTNQSLFKTIGFELEEFGNNALILHATPAELTLSNSAKFIEELLAELAVINVGKPSQLKETMARHLALHGAIQHGKKLTKEEMESLFRQLMLCSQPNYGIRNDKTLLRYTDDQLVKAFGN